MHQKSSYVIASSDTDFALNSMLNGSSSQWSDGFNASRIVFHLCHLSVGTNVYTGSRLTYTQYMLACLALCICWFRVTLLWVLEIAMDCSTPDRQSHPIRVHLTFSQTQLVEVVTWQIQYVKRDKGLAYSSHNANKRQLTAC